MHKITKGLKKKKKGKKSKHKDEELFKPEELEAYRKEHQATEEPTSSGKNEEWKKFLALTSGVDDILHKTKDDLDRIKSTSFFQRVPPPSETQKQEEEVKTEEKPPEPQLGIVEVSESESDEEDEDDIFDTAYIDAIATGEVKLAYIPDSPTKEEGDDPFDTSYAERAILGPAAERKGKKLVPIGAAVEVLTGRVQLPTCATKRPVNRRQILKERDLLLGSFDDNANNVAASPEQIQKTLLDDDEIPIPDEPIDLSKTLHPITPVVEEVKESKTQSIVKEFEEDEDDAEFAALAAESLHKEPKVISEVVIPQLEPVQVDGNWNAAFEDSTACTVEEVVDPFDTTFAENILPGKAELRIIENEVLNDDFDFNPREEDTLKTILKTVNVSQTNKTLNAEPIKNDLLGGSNTDLTQLNSDVLRPSETKDENYIEYGDPFDTSIVESAKQPGQTELKFLEREFLGEIKVQQLSFEDDDFDPRAGESRGRSVSRPEVLNFSKTVSFDVSSPTQSNLDVDQRVSKPLTPFYVRKSSVPEEVFSPEEPEDPFDTSFVSKVTPGKAELKLIENELFVERNLSLSDQDFDPRDEKKVAIAQVVQSIQGIKDPTKVVEEEKVEIDLLSADTNIPGKVLTPNLEPVRQQQEELSYVDPFDTSIACNILPGKTELKLLETELIEKVVPKVPSDPDFNLRGTADLISHTGDTIFEKPLSPNKVSFDIEEDYDPFDTSIANNIQPEDEYTSPPMASNPFLLEGDDYQDGNTTMDNPFLSQTATSVSTNSTNPFAFDPMDLDPAEGEVPQEPTNAFMGYTSASQPSFFMNEPVTVTASSQDFFSTAQDVIVTTTPAQKPTDLDLKYTNDVANGGPTRPPPPRPPPSKETQDLLMSVMGAMDATSSHLLDKIPPTRTPSPVNMRDLHSPSPTPDATFGDLLDVSDAKTQPQNFTNVTNTDEDFLSLGNDVNQNPPEPEAVVPPMPQRPPEPVRAPPPMRPQPPVRPPRPQPPAIAQEPPKKPPPPRAAPPAVAAKPAQDDFDMFGEGPKPPATNADILNLYNAPKEERVRDLLFDNVEPEVNAEINVVESEKEISPVQTQEIKESSSTFISPEVTQNDLQMDTSDSQSKGSVSSVTFNPFATTEDNVSPVVPPVGPQDLTPLENNVFQQDVTPVSQPMDIFGTTQLVSNANAYDYPQPHQQSIFLSEPEPIIQDNFYSDNQTTDEPKADAFSNFGETNDEFDAFAQKFDSVAKDENRNGAFDSFGEGGDAWGNTANEFESSAFGNDSGFGNEESFDAFLALQEPPVVPQSTPNRVSKAGSQESDEEKDFSVFIRPKTNEDFSGGVMPVIAPPPAHVQAAFTDTSPRFNPFDQSEMATTQQADPVIPYGDGEMKRSDSAETPPTPLFDEDVSQPLEPFPRINFEEEGWEMHLRQPNKKKITGQRFWKKIWVCLSYQPDCVLLQLYNLKGDKDPFQELPLQPCYSVSDIGAQQYDQFGKIFTVKLQYIFYKERPGVRPGQVKKAERITNKLSQFAAYAIQGDYQGVKEFGSDLKKLGLPVEHAPQVSQLMKLGSLNYEDLKQFSFSIEEALFKLQAHRDRALQYKMEEVQITAVDELYVEQDSDGHIERQIARVRLFFLGFLTGMPDIELGVNDMRRQGKEVVGRHDIIPVVTEEWIRLENIEFHNCIQQEEWERNHIIRFKPPDACYIELMRFRVRPPKNRELPLQLKAQICVTGTRVEMKADVLVPGFASRKLGQIPCEDVMIRFPIPECWIYLFRVEKHFRYGSVKSAHRRTGKIKGIERILGTVDTLQENLIEVTSGQAKYEHQHRAIVWRCPRLPKEGQGAYTTHNMVCKIALTSYDQMPEKLAEYCHVEFTMPATQVSHMTCRSVSLQNSDSDEPPEKYVRYLARHEYRVGIEHTEGENPNAYAAATFVSKPKEAPIPEKPAPVAEESSSDSD